MKRSDKRPVAKTASLFAVPSPPRESPVAPYLKDPTANGTYAVELHVEVIVGETRTRICTARLDWMYWSFRSIFAHQCIGACGVSSGDIIATGRASGSTPDSLGCLLEMTMGGKKLFRLLDGSTRAFLQDGDSVRITGFAGAEGDGAGFGDWVGNVVPAPVLEGERQNGSLRAKKLITMSNVRRLGNKHNSDEQEYV